MVFLDTGGVWEAAKSAVLAKTVTWEDAVACMKLFDGPNFINRPPLTV